MLWQSDLGLHCLALRRRKHLRDGKTDGIYRERREWCLNPSVLFVGHRQTVQTASAQFLHCLLTKCSIGNYIKLKNTTQQPTLKTSLD